MNLRKYRFSSPHTNRWEGASLSCRKDTPVVHPEQKLVCMSFWLFFLNCVVSFKTPASRLLWQPALLLCRSLCLPGRRQKKEQKTKLWSCCWCNLYMDCAVWVSVCTQSRLWLFSAESLLWASQLLQTTQRFCVENQLLRQKKRCFSEGEIDKSKSFNFKTLCR